MISSQVLPFVAVVGVITASPGPDAVLVVRNTQTGGLRHGLLTAVGCSTGLLVWGFASALGIATIMSASSELFAMIRFVGGVYLAWLGLRMVFSTCKPAEAGPSGATPTHGNRRHPLVQGLMTDLLNPKAAAFFTALLPQFVTANDRVFTTTLLLAGIASGAAFAGLLAYASIAWRARIFLEHPRLRRLFDRVTGLVLLGMGVRMLAHEVQ